MKNQLSSQNGKSNTPSQRRSSCRQGVTNKSEFTASSYGNLGFIGVGVTMKVSRPDFVYGRKIIPSCSQLNNFQLNNGSRLLKLQ